MTFDEARSLQLNALIEFTEWDVDFQQREIGRAIEELDKRKQHLKELKARRGDLQL